MNHATKLTLALFMAATPAFADSDGSVGKERQGGLASREAGTLHPGHVATLANDKYNTPSAEYHFNDAGQPITDGYASGPGGWAETRKGGKDE